MRIIAIRRPLGARLFDWPRGRAEDKTWKRPKRRPGFRPKRYGAQSADLTAAMSRLTRKR